MKNNTDTICHPRVFLSGISTLLKKWLRLPITILGNDNTARAFTLIELLVVVLIIGILSAIALPYYQKAVEKARMTEAIMAVEKIAQAQQIYKLANDSYTRSIEDLDIGYEGSEGNYCGTIKARYTKNFMIAASNCSGDQIYISIAKRLSDDATYALAISLSGSRGCIFYEGATDYEKQLCRAWQNGN